MDAVVPRGFASLLLVLLAGCATGDVPSLTEQVPEAELAFGASEDERKIVAESDLYEVKLREQGLVLEDPALQSYVAGIGARLVPEGLPEGVAFHFVILREPAMNAFALPQGGIYLHAGLLARLENEAQLAHVLAHEITHTLHRHSLTFMRSVQQKTMAAKVAELVLVPAAVFAAGGAGASLTGTLIGLTHAAAVTGFGRENEEEADREGIARAAAAGYRVEEVPRLFELLNEVEDPGSLEAFFYASHPTNEARQRYTRELIESGQVTSALGATTNLEAYRQATRGVVLENVKLRIRARHYDFALQEVARALEHRGEDAWLHHQAGEAHRLMAKDPEGAAREAALRKGEPFSQQEVVRFRERAASELDAAVVEYQRALELDPSLAQAHRGLGLAARARDDRETARRELEAYLAASENPRDRRYIERILEEIGS